MMGIEPITRKEMFMASAAGESVSTPTPVTREEYFLSKIGGGGGGGGTQSDLSQTDITQPDYVKGVIRQESLPDGYPYKAQGTILDGTFEFADINGMYRHQITDENFTIVDGKSYTVIWDGEAYQCVATIFSNTLALGNLAIFGVPDADTGEPFLFIYLGNGQKMIGTNSTAATHTVTVSWKILHHIASEFLPALTSPNGTKYKLTVSDDGTLSAVQV